MSNFKKESNELDYKKLVYVVYETTNTITQQKYIGIFSYHPLQAKGVYKEMTYIGQGITHDGQAERMKSTEFVKNVIQYGFENFKRENLLITNDEQEAYGYEEKLVNTQWVDSPMTLNQMCGGKYPKWGTMAKKRKSVQTVGGKNPRAKVVIDTDTGKIYACIKDAAKDLDLNYSTTKDQLRNHKHPYLIYG